MPGLFSAITQKLQELFSRPQKLTPKQKSLKTISNIYRHALISQFHPDEPNLELENVFVTPVGVNVFYHLTNPEQITVFTMLFETSAPKHALWHKPKVITEFANLAHNWQFVTLTKDNGRYDSFWTSKLLGLELIRYPNYRISREIKLKNPTPLLDKSHGQNPLITPHTGNHWESFTTFNPAAFYAADKVHILYRAQGPDYVSRIGYATSSDGVTINYRHNKPVYLPTMPFEGATLPPGDPHGEFASGGGSGGVEDPRTTIIDDRLYMTYVAYNGWSGPRVAITSIALTDFLNHRFLWEKPVLISPPGVIDKSAVIFPEKVNGKYVIMHRVFPDILIDYVDTLAFNGQNFLKGHAKISPRSKEWWDSRKIGAGAPPLKTKSGWLLIYQGVDDKDASEYKVGAMLLDLQDPAKVLARSAEPILLPRETYENVGFKAGVVYPCGAIIQQDTLFVYYGGADSYVCVATASLDSFLDQLISTGKSHLSPVDLAV